MKLISKILILAILFAGLMINSGWSKGISITNDKNITVEVVVKMKDSEFWKTVKIGAEAAGKEFGVNVIFDAPNAEEDIDDQIKIVEDAIRRKVDAIVLAACDYKRLVSVTDKAIDHGIPVLIIDSALASSRVSTFISTDNYAAGKMLGNQLVERVGKKCNIAIMNFVNGTSTADDRMRGLLGIISKYPGIKILSQEYCNSNEELASKLAGNLLKKYSSINAIIALNAQATTGTAHAVKELKRNGITKIIGFDNSPEELDLLEDNTIQSVIVQNPYAMGYLGIKNAVKVLNKEKIPKFIETKTVQIDKSNIYLPENQRLLFPFVN